MSAEQYYEKITDVLKQIHVTQREQIKDAAERMTSSIAAHGRVYLFGSGHSVIPVLDIFPRYGSFVGFFPLYDPRLMWFNVVGPGGARELLWLERTEGYARVFLQSYALQRGDCILIFSHGGLNAAPVDVALAAKAKGLTVISVSSLANRRIATTTVNNCLTSPTLQSTTAFRLRMHLSTLAGRRIWRQVPRWPLCSFQWRW